MQATVLIEKSVKNASFNMTPCRKPSIKERLISSINKPFKLMNMTMNQRVQNKSKILKRGNNFLHSLINDRSKLFNKSIDQVGKAYGYKPKSLQYSNNSESLK